MGELADIARTEQTNPPPLIECTPFKLTRTTGTLVRLEAAVVVFQALGGPPLAKVEQLSKEGRRANTPPMRIVGEAMAALDEITFIAKDDDRLTMPEPRRA